MANGRHVFISYASDMKRQAQELTSALEGQGMEAWVDFKDLRPGQRLRDELERALDTAQSFVILVGSGSRATPWQEAEWSAALARAWSDREKMLLPVIFGEGSPPPFLRNWVPLRVDPDHQASTWTGRVLDTLRNPAAESVQEMSLQNREERRKRLDQITRSAEELRKWQGNEPPPVGPKVPTD
jgi:hypothetical protein